MPPWRITTTSPGSISRTYSPPTRLNAGTSDAAIHASLISALAAAPGAEVTVDLASQTLALPGGEKVSFPIDGFSKTCLLEGVDELGYILTLSSEIAAFERRHDAAPGTGGPGPS